MRKKYQDAGTNFIEKCNPYTILHVYVIRIFDQVKIPQACPAPIIKIALLDKKNIYLFPSVNIKK